MNITTCLKKIIIYVCVITFTFITCPFPINAQKNVVTKKSRNFRNSGFTKKPIKLKTISAGVMNARAINLVKPEFPPSAKAVNVYGMVSVSVLIDENGKVIEAQAVDGHLFLHPSAIKAALESTFEPIFSSGTAVRVRGTIIYKFIPSRWNWLEVGYTLTRNSTYYTIENLPMLLPFDFQDEIQLLNQLPVVNENQTQIIEAVTASIKSKIGNEAKDLWLFEVGIALGEIKRICCRNDTEKFQNAVQKIELVILNAPENAFPNLIAKLQELNRIIKPNRINLYNQKLYQFLNNLEVLFPSIGK